MMSHPLCMQRISMFTIRIRGAGGKPRHSPPATSLGKKSSPLSGQGPASDAAGNGLPNAQPSSPLRLHAAAGGGRYRCPATLDSGQPTTELDHWRHYKRAPGAVSSISHQPDICGKTPPPSASPDAILFCCRSPPPLAVSLPASRVPSCSQRAPFANSACLAFALALPRTARSSFGLAVVCVHPYLGAQEKSRRHPALPTLALPELHPAVIRNPPRPAPLRLASISARSDLLPSSGFFVTSSSRCGISPSS